MSGKFLWKSCGIIIALLNWLYKLVNSGCSAFCSGIIAIFIGFMFLLSSNYGLNFFLFSGFHEDLYTRRNQFDSITYITI